MKDKPLCNRAHPGHCRCGGAVQRREFLVLSGGAFLTLLAPRLRTLGADDAPPRDDLTDAYAKHLRETKGILDIRMIHKSGAGPNFLDVVVVSAGFTADQMGDFHNVCEGFAKTLLSHETWKRYRSLVNVHAVFIGDESVDCTKLGVGGHKGEVLGCDDELAVEYSRIAANSAATVVIHNSDFSTASNGVWGVAALNKADVATPLAAVHELGHGMAGLGDEYIQREGPFDEPPESLRDTVNVTAEPNPKLCKWHYWTEESWPGLFGASRRLKGAKVANFEGAGWPSKIYRPEETCLMRGERDEFCLVCNETMEANLFRYIDLFKTAEPANADVVLWKGESADFRLIAIDLISRPPDWLKSRLALYLDGERVAVSDRGEVSFRLANTASEPGVRHLGANLNVQNDRVRRDFGFLSRSRSWRVRVLPYARPELAVAQRLSVASDGAVDLPVEIKHDRPEMFRLTMAHAPAGATLEGGRFRWKPAGAVGSWRVDFTVAYEDEPVVTESLGIHVSRSEKADGAIKVHPVAPVDAVTGTKVARKLKAVAKDGGHLLYEPVDVLRGVEVDRYSGNLSWTPQTGQAGPQRMRFRVHNGAAEHEFSVVFFVRNAAAPSPVSFCNEYVPQTLDALERLRKSPIVYRRLFECLRLLRDRYPPIFAKALVEGKSLYEQLEPKLRGNCLEELHLHAWQFTDKPEILKWMRTAAAGAKTKDAELLIGRLDEIDRYNAGRLRPASSSE